MKNVRVQQVTLTIAYDQDAFQDPDTWSWGWIIGAHRSQCRILDLQSEAAREPTPEEAENVGAAA